MSETASAAEPKPYRGALATPLLQEISDMVRAERWADFAFLQRRPIPWTRPAAPLERLRIALVTTAGLHLAGERAFRVMEAPLGDPDFRIIPHGTPPERLDLQAPYVDRKFAARDPEVALPQAALERLVRSGVVGSAAARHYSLCGGLLRAYPGLDDTTRRMAATLREDRADAVLLIPTCTVCVHTTSLLAGELEALGLATVALSLVPELSRIAGAPRTLHPRFPYGAPVGDPGHGALHEAVVSEALRLLETATAPGELVESALRWRREPAVLQGGG